MATIADVIKAVDRLRPNQYSAADKTRWLSDCDGEIFNELVSNYEKSDDMPESFAGYAEDTADDTELLVKAPHDVLYRYWLMAQIDLHNMELAKYNNTSVQFNVARQNFMNWYNRTHMPLHKAKYFKL